MKTFWLGAFKEKKTTFDDTFFLTLSGALFAFLGLLIRATLKSRCKEFSCCCVSCVRDVALPGMEPDIENADERR